MSSPAHRSNVVSSQIVASATASPSSPGQPILVKVRSKAAEGHVEEYNRALQAIADLDKLKHPETELFAWDSDSSTGAIDLIELYPSSDAWYSHYKDGDEAGLYTELQKHIDFEHGMDVKIVGQMKKEHEDILSTWGAKFMTSTGGYVGKLMHKESSVLVKVRSKALSGHLESYNKALEAIAELDRQAHPETEAFVWDFDLETGFIDLIEVYPSSIAWYKHYKDGEERGLYTELQNHIDFEHGMDVKIMGPMEPEHKEILAAWGAKFLTHGGFLF